MSVSITEQNGEWILTMTVPNEVVSAECKVVSTTRLGTPRIVEEQYEDPDGTPIVINRDILGDVRERIIAGPIADLKAGENRICVWHK